MNCDLTATNHWAEVRNAKSRRFLTFLRNFLMSFAVSWALDSVTSFFFRKRHVTNIGIKHGFSCINIRQVPWEVLKTEAEGRGFQHLPKRPGEC